MYLKDIINGTCLRSVNDREGYNISETYLKKTGDSKDNTVSFASEDSLTPVAWTDVPVLATGEKHSSILNKISTMFKNVRWLYKMLGTTDISAIADGTLTGAVSMLNTGIQDVDGIKYINFGEFDYNSMSLDDVMKKILADMIPMSPYEVYLGNFRLGGMYKVILQSYATRDFSSAIVFSYMLTGIIGYRKSNGVLSRVTTNWNATMI